MRRCAQSGTQDSYWERKAQSEEPPAPTKYTLRVLMQRIQELMKVTFSGEDEYVVLACAGHVTDKLALALHDTFQVKRPVEAVIVAYGEINTSKDGYILIRWRGPIPETFYDELDYTPDLLFYTPFPAGPLDTFVAPWRALPDA